MATAAQVLKTALQRVLVQGSEADLEPDEYQDAIFAMNTLLFAWDAEGIQLGYTWVNDLGDDVTVPVGALRGVIANVAIEASPDYAGVISPGLAAAASEGLKACRLIGQHVPTTSLPGTLPIGSGNEGGEVRDRRFHFYPDLEAEILAETTGAISLETGTDGAGDATTPHPTVEADWFFLSADGTRYEP
jgi:hypothetical protein